eukprot:1641175-Amphidinium_carterae.1
MRLPHAPATEATADKVVGHLAVLAFSSCRVEMGVASALHAETTLQVTKTCPPIGIQRLDPHNSPQKMEK